MAIEDVKGPVKQQLVDQLPKRFKGLKFGIQYVSPNHFVSRIRAVAARDS